MPELQLLASGHLGAVREFERENRAYFARSLTDRGDTVYDALAEHHQALLDEQDAGVCAFFVLADRDGSILGRFNLYDFHDGSARVGYRVAERAAGRGVATQALIKLCRKAGHDYDLLTAALPVSRISGRLAPTQSGLADFCFARRPGRLRALAKRWNPRRSLVTSQRPYRPSQIRTTTLFPRRRCSAARPTA